MFLLLLVLPASASAFPDVPAGHQYEEAIEGLQNYGIIGGYVDGRFGLNDPVKRAQFAKMIVGALKIAPSASTATRFTDLGTPDAGGYPHRFVQAAYDNGITKGTEDPTKFAPWSSIRRDQVVSMIVRGIDGLHPGLLEDPPAGKIGLYSGVGEPHGKNLCLADMNGLLDGVIDLLNWNIYANATRGEVAQILWNVLKFVESGGPAPPGGDVWVYADGTGDYPTLEAAVAGIAPGATIHLGPGTFRLSKTLSVDFSFKLVGNGMSGDAASVLTCADTVIRVVGVDFRAEKIRVLSTASSKSSNALSAEDATVEIRDCFLGGGNRWSDLGGCGLYLYGTTTGTVFGCMATENDLHGIAVQDEADVTLERNVCVYNTQCGISFSGDANGRLRDFNLCSYNGISGIAAQRQATLFVEKNICQYNAVAGISFFGTASGTIRSNECKYNQSHGIALWEQSSALVEYNTAASNTEAGICFEGTSGGTARNNTCSANKWGIYVGATAAPSIGSNSLYGNAVNPQLYDKRSM